MTDAILQTPGQAEAAFYSAIESSDLDAMMAVWSNDSDIVCIHPHGPRLIGPQEIREGWRQIMVHSPRMHFSIAHLNTVHNEDLAIRFVNESIHVDDEDDSDFTILATNVYRRMPDGWRIILHHASPTPEALQNIMGSTEESEDGGEVTFH